MDIVIFLLFHLFGEEQLFVNDFDLWTMQDECYSLVIDYNALDSEKPTMAAELNVEL